VFPAGAAVYTPLEAQILTLTGVPAGCTSAAFEIDLEGAPLPLVVAAFNPETTPLPYLAPPLVSGQFGSGRLDAFFTGCSHAAGTPGATGKLFMRVAYPPTIIP
jgi:hypothetical protein